MNTEHTLELARALGWKITNGTLQEGDDEAKVTTLVHVPGGIVYDTNTPIGDTSNGLYSIFHSAHRRAQSQHKLVPPEDLGPYLIAGFREMKRAGRAAIEDARQAREREDETCERLRHLKNLVRAERDVRRDLDTALTQHDGVPLQDLDVSFGMPREEMDR